MYGILFATLYCRINRTHTAIKKTKGRITALTEIIENILAVSIKKILRKLGFSISCKEILDWRASLFLTMTLKYRLKMEFRVRIGFFTSKKKTHIRENEKKMPWSIYYWRILQTFEKDWLNYTWKTSQIVSGIWKKAT